MARQNRRDIFDLNEVGAFHAVQLVEAISASQEQGQVPSRSYKGAMPSKTGKRASDKGFFGNEF